MIQIPGYKTLTKVYESTKTVVYTAQRLNDLKAVIFKVLKDEYPTQEIKLRYTNEYNFINKVNSNRVIKAYALEKYKNSIVIVLEDIHGQTLKSIKSSIDFNMESLIDIFIKITEGLKDIHASNIVHRDINPANIIFNNETKELKIIDFGISSLLSDEKNYSIIGTFSYIAPEQTGRINRPIDFRSDFYSLGVTFYEMLTKRLPFETNDVMELIHCHIAKMSDPLSLLNPLIPTPLSDIIFKLMSKNPDERYQSSFGIKADLEECLKQLRSHNEINYFDIGQCDISSNFQIPNKLYGREKEIEFLISKLENVCKGNLEIVFVSGYQGTGKSSLVNHIYKQIFEKNGYVITCKLDKLNQDIPYSCIISGLTEIIRKILSKSIDKIAVWRKIILNALGNNGKIITDAIPDLEIIIGKQPLVPDIGPCESQNRFNLVMSNFIQAFGSQKHPILLFLDNIDSIDIPTLKLLEILMTDYSAKYMFIIGTYTQNISKANCEGFIFLQNALKKAEEQFSEINLLPLNKDNIDQFIKDALKYSPSNIDEISFLCHQKTGGNPFFLHQFFKLIHEKKIIKLDNVKGAWIIDSIEKIQDIEFTENVLVLLSNKIEQLNPETINLLKLASCIGNKFDLSILSFINNKNISDTISELSEAVYEGLIIPLNSPSYSNESEISYKFSHDRIYDSVYLLLNENTKMEIHLSIGRFMIQNTNEDNLEDNLEENIFDIINHINKGQELVTDPTEKEKFARLNLMGGIKAKSTGAFEHSFKYLSFGIKLLDNDCFKTNYNLAINLYNEAYESAYLCGDFDVTDNLYEIIHKNAKSSIDKARAVETKIEADISINKPLNAIKHSLDFLKTLGIYFPEKPKKIHLITAFLKTKLLLLGKKPDSLLNLPEATDINIKASMQIIATLGRAAYLSQPELFPLLVFKLVNLSLKYGNSSFSSVGYATYGAILCGIFGDVDLGYDFGMLGKKLVKKFKAKNLEAKTNIIVNHLIRPWKEPLKNTLKDLLENYKIGLDIGDFGSAALSAAAYISLAFIMTKDLRESEKMIASFIPKIARLKQDTALNICKICHQAALNLLHGMNLCDRLSGDIYNEYIMLSVHKKNNDRASIASLYFYKFVISFFRHNYSNCVENLSNAEKYLDSLIGTPAIPLFYLIDSLSRLLLYNESKRKQKIQILLAKINLNRKNLKKFSMYCPANHLGILNLVDAEYARAIGDDMRVIKSYDAAIKLAHENDYTSVEALANEFAGKFYLSKEMNDIAAYHLKKAYYLYSHIGGRLKVSILESEYPNLFQTSSPKTKKISFDDIDLNSIGSYEGDIFDLVSVIKTNQAISEEIELQNLLKKLLKIVTENAGAEYGFLILGDDRGVSSNAYYFSNQTMTEKFELISFDKSNKIAHSIINFTARTKEYVVLTDASNESIFSHDKYIKEKKPKSILCLPIIHLDHLTAVLYLENNLSIGTFNKERVQMLGLIASQASISIENAKIYNKLKESEKQYKSLFENAVEGICQFSPTGKIMNVNSSMAMLFGFNNPDELLSTVKHFMQNDYFDNEQREFFRDTILKKHKMIGFEGKFYRKDKTMFWSLLSVHAVFNQKGEILFYEGSFFDITERKEKEKAEMDKLIAEQANIRLKELDTLKADFLSSVSHELRAPLTSILGFAKLILKDFLKYFMPLSISHSQIIKKSGRIKENLEIIVKESINLTRLINNVLDLSKIESEKVVWNDSLLKINDIIIDALNEVKEDFSKKPEIKIVLNIDNNLPYISVDKYRMTQVFTNLLSNTVKFSLKGLVEIKTELSGEYIKICVEDSGIGISQSDLIKIFDKFHQKNQMNYLRDKPNGTGLGLSICKHIIEHYNGKIWAESIIGKGSKFIILLPIMDANI
ncbi:MAG: AAA family ATPase [Desulfobacterales bacterium]|nr:AAA family ATPase [Desulfobacterales bacterium]